MVAYATIRIGRLTMREDWTVAETSGSSGREFTLTGQESIPNKTLLQVKQRRDDILNMRGEFVAIAFTEKPELNGFYDIQDTSASVQNWYGQHAVVDWALKATRVGSSSEVELESRLSGAITRVNGFAVTGKRLHAPAIGHVAYWSGATSPLFIDRAGADGTIRAYRDLPQGINPRWGIAVTNYEKGRVRFLDSNGLERTGKEFPTASTGWELSNSLLKVTPGSAGNSLDISPYAAGAYQTRTWEITYNTGPAVSFGVADYVSMLDNNYHSCTIRLTKDWAPGRMTLDLTLRRGSTFVEMYFQSTFATTFVIKRATATASTATSGYVAQTAADGNGMKSIVGSALSGFTADTANCGISKAAVSALDVVAGFSFSASAGDLPADIYGQYIASPAEIVRGVRR